MKTLSIFFTALILLTSIPLQSSKAYNDTFSEEREGLAIVQRRPPPPPPQLSPDQAREQLRQLFQPEVDTIQRLNRIFILTAVLNAVIIFSEIQHLKSPYPPQITLGNCYGMFSWTTVEGFSLFHGTRKFAQIVGVIAEGSSNAPSQNRSAWIVRGVQQLVTAGLLYGINYMIMTSADDDPSGYKESYTYHYGPTTCFIGISEMGYRGVKNIIGAFTNWW